MNAAISILIFCLLTGSGLIVAGVYVLASTGLALLVAGALLLGVAGLMRNGLSANVQ